MPQLNNEKYAAHMMECAEIANRIAGVLGLRDDAAKQACFATVSIDARSHNLFLEPTPKDSKTPVIQPEPAAAKPATVEVETTKRDEAAAAKADAQINDVPQTTTPEQSTAVQRQELEKAIQQAIKLLNDEGHEPKITVGGMNAFIKKEFDGKANMSQLDGDELEKLTKLMSERLDALRKRNAEAKAKSATAQKAKDDDIDW